MKIKNPIWLNLEDYPEEYRLLCNPILALSCRDYQERVWVRGEGPEVDDYGENVDELDDTIRSFKINYRAGHIKPTVEQTKAILRVHAMMVHFDQIMDEGWDIPEDEFYNWALNHPYFEKIRQAAQQALDLLKIEKTMKA